MIVRAREPEHQGKIAPSIYKWEVTPMEYQQYGCLKKKIYGCLNKTHSMTPDDIPMCVRDFSSIYPYMKSYRQLMTAER